MSESTAMDVTPAVPAEPVADSAAAEQKPAVAEISSVVKTEPSAPSAVPTNGAPKDTPPSEAQITNKLRDLLVGADLDSLTSRKVRKQLEEVFGCDLTEQKEFIDETLVRLLPEKEESARKPSAKVERERDRHAENSDSSAESGSESETTDAFGARKPRKAALAAAKKQPKPRQMKKSAPKQSSQADADGDEAPDTPSKPKPKKRQNLVLLKPGLSEFFDGAAEMTRGEIVKGIHVYVNEHNLKDPADRRFFLVDEKLAKVFGKKRRVSMFKMSRDLEKCFVDKRFI